MRNICYKLKLLAVVFFSTILSIVIVELALNILDIPKTTISGWTKCRSSDKCNQLHFRGQQIQYRPDDFVTVLIGDSLVAALSLNDEHLPERRLEQHLTGFKDKVKVFTLGTSGYGQDQQYLSLKKYFEKYRADLVLLLFSAQTDVTDNTFPVSGANNTPKPTFWLVQGELRGPTEGWLEKVKTRVKLLLLWQRYGGTTIGTQRNQLWEEHILPPPYQPMTEYKQAVDYSWHETWKTNPDKAYKGIEQEKVGPAGQFTPRSQRRQYGIDLTRKLIFRIKSLAESHGGRFIIFKEERPWEFEDGDQEKVYFLNGRYYKTSIKQYQKNLKDIFEGFENYRIPLHIDNYKVSKEDMHLNRDAIEILMKQLANIISKKPYFHD